MANNAFAAFPPLRRRPGQPVLHPAVLNLERGVLIRDGENVLQGFVRLPEIPSIPCCHERGVIMFYVKWTRTSPQHDFEETEDVVVVKKLFREKLHPDAQEDPFQEIHLMQRYGDNVHISKILEALCTPKYIYLVMPWLGHDLFNTMWYPRNDERQLPIVRHPWTPARVKALLLNLLYFQVNALILRDVSPCNIICSVHDDHCPHIDLAMALQVVVIEGIPQRIAAGQPWCGKGPYTAPEAIHQRELGFSLDIWSMAVSILTIALGEQNIWNLCLLGNGLFDLTYHFLIMRGALNNPEMLTESINELNNINAHEYRHIVRNLQRIHDMDPKLRNLLARMLKPNAGDRPSIRELLVDPYFTA